MPSIFGPIDLPTPLVIYYPTVPEHTNILKATLKNTALYNQFSSSPARVVASESKGLSAVYYQSGSNPAGKTGGCFPCHHGRVIRGKSSGLQRDSLYKDRTMGTPIGAHDQVQFICGIQNDPNPCVDVTLVIERIQQSHCQYHAGDEICCVSVRALD
ncbi:hypothetical protein BGX38DRAFT_1271038 [Terfezia claveryi]|nr:hypothetical protein BGX38DRAFT_1271038 [Terfezia claveryi]